MKIKDKYHLEFFKSRKPIDNSIYNGCICKSTTTAHHGLDILRNLYKEDCIALKEDLIATLNGTFTGDNEEWVGLGNEGGEQILISSPNITLREMITIPITEMLQLLDEWMEFCGY